MLLSILVFGIGCLIGRLRGGKWSGLTTAPLRSGAWLVLGVTTVLVLNVLDPAFPLAWALIGTIGFFTFGLRNLHITGIGVMMLGLLMNTAALIANGAMPVSELALQSVGEVNDSGQPEITGLRESTSTATRLSAFGDVIPVPIVNSVVSLGDLVMLVALANTTSNLFLRARRHHLSATVSTDQTRASRAQSDEKERAELIMTRLQRKPRPAHAAHLLPRRRVYSSSHVPAHAKTTEEPSSLVFDEVTDVDVLAAPSAHGVDPQTRELQPTESATIDLTNAEQPAIEDVRIDLTDTMDRRPIIDLTESPTDAQLSEFLRRRDVADAELEGQHRTGQRRGRAPHRVAGVAQSPR